jgi:hypothetical protein
MEKKAIAYTVEIVLGNTGLVIEPAFQRQRIERYAKENDITVVAWFEEEGRHEDLFARPKIKELTEYKEPYDLVLVERTWAISRRWREIKALMKVLEDKHAKLEATTKLWDCISQMARAYYRPIRQAGETLSCALAGEQRERTSINLVETYGRVAANRRDRYAKIVVRPSGFMPKVSRPRRLVFAKVRLAEAT